MSRIKNTKDLKLLVHQDFVEKDGVLYFIDVPKDVEPAWQKKEPRNKKAWSYWRKGNYEFLKRELNALPSEYILLDIGAGPSQFLDIFERFHYIAVDFYPYEKVRIICDLNKPLPLLDASADVLVLSNMLEHSAEPNLLLSECYRVLRPGGIMLGTAPFMIQIHQRPYDYYRYTDINLHYLLKKHAFVGIDIRPVAVPFVLMFAVTTSFFIHLIQKTEYSKNSIFQKAYVFGLRVLWKIIRIVFAFFDPILKKCAGDEDLPLGYHFKARK